MSHSNSAVQAPVRYTAALGVLATLFFMWGFCTVLNDVLVPHLKAVFEMNYVQTMLIQFAFYLGYFVLSMPSARLIEWIGYKRSILTGLLVMAAGCFLFILAAVLPSYPAFLIALFVLAGGITVLQVAANPYVTVLGPPETSSIRLNLVQAFNSMGTFVAPVFGGMLILSRSATGTAEEGAVVSVAERMADAQAVQLPYLFIGGVLILLALLIWASRLPDVSVETKSEGPQSDSVLRHPLLILGVAAIFLYVGAEVTIGSFLINYISSPHISDLTAAQAAHYVTYYWGGAMVGRFIGAWLMRHVHPARLLGIASVLAGTLIVVSMMSTGHVALVAIILVGLCNSIMFPTIFSLAIQGLGSLTGRGSGLLVMAICGGGVLPMIQGSIADNWGLTISFVAPAVCYLYVLYFAWVCLRKRKPDEKFSAAAVISSH